MSQILIGQFHNQLHDLRKFSGSTSESIVREAFKSLLWSYSRQRDLVFIAEYGYETPAKKQRRIDGAILHSLRVPLGYWESKDEDDDLDAEIAKKFRAGYPQDNILFEDSRQAVLIQNRQEVMRCAVEDGEALGRLLDLFFGWERPEIAEFRKAIRQFQTDLPLVLHSLRDMIETAAQDNARFAEASDRFLHHAKETINPAVTEADVREMLIQHILTEEIFSKVFGEDDFHRQNNVARELYALEGTFFTGAVKKDLLKQLDPYYAAIRATAAQITSHREKQSFLKLIYEGFYQVYNKKAADRLGVVYTPNEIVRFMVESADHLCVTHFGKRLIDHGVEILDPATGTGTFVCELIDYFRGDPRKLAHKYKEELHANEVAILPYYVANLNIEATYAAVSGQYAEFPNLCFVDTLDNVAGLGKFSGHQEDLFGALSEENVERIKRQNRRKISVIIGNPPYNANQQNENDNNKNRTYQRIDERIRATYIRQSTAQKTKAYDPYVRFHRWASDRLNDDGILAFVTNRSFITARNMDGFRKCLAEDFQEIWIVDLKGDARTSGEQRRREGGNVFSDAIRVGIAICICIRNKKLRGCRIRYEAVRDYATADEKKGFLAARPLRERPFTEIRPDTKHNWIGLPENDWEGLIPVADKKMKASGGSSKERAIFKLFSLGIVTNRDEWAYDFDKKYLSDKVEYFAGRFNNEIMRWFDDGKPSNITNFVKRDIKWTSELEERLRKTKRIEFSFEKIVYSHYRPFVERFTYFQHPITHRPYQNEAIFPNRSSVNQTIITVVEPKAAFSALGSKALPNKDFFMPSAAQHFPRYRYTTDGTRLDNITDWALRKFEAAYGKSGRLDPRREAGGDDGEGERGERGEKRRLTKDAIFAYVYAVLHDPVYRETYAINLKREFPRIPFYRDFWRWVEWGERLLALHIGYESVEPWPLTRIDSADDAARAAGLKPKPVLKSLPEAGVVVLDSETQLTGVPQEAWDYRLGNRSAIDWVLDQHKEKKPKDPTIREKFDTYRFADHKERVADLLARVVRVSVETREVTEAMKSARR